LKQIAQYLVPTPKVLFLAKVALVFYTHPFYTLFEVFAHTFLRFTIEFGQFWLYEKEQIHSERVIPQSDHRLLGFNSLVFLTKFLLTFLISWGQAIDDFGLKFLI
jgi:hypothetical protein